MLGVAADNLANLDTPGFKQSEVHLATTASSGPTGAQVGSGVQVSEIAPDQSQGALLHQNGPANLAVSGDGYFVLEGSEGQRTYTRDGTFHANAEGHLVSSNGNRVLGVRGDPAVSQGELGPLFVLNPDPRSLDADSDRRTLSGPYRIEQDGTIRSSRADGSSSTVGQIRLARFNNPAGLKSLGDNNFEVSANSGSAQIGNPGSGGLGRLNTHSYEASNSDVAQNLISTVRAKTLFRANLKVLSVVDSLTEELMTMIRR